MKIKTNLLKPNPYRNLDRYPVDRAKIETLKKSIEETEFWDNLLARKSGGEYQIAYGHHRLVALQELGIEEIDIPVKEISDFQMVKIMANENSIQYGADPSVILETVRASRDFLNAELAKYDSWDELEQYPDEPIRVLFTNIKGDWKKCKQSGVGRETILKFLGDGWKQWQIQDAITILKDEDVDLSIVDEFTNITTAIAFNKAAKNLNVPVEERKDLAQKIQGKYRSQKDIAKAVENEVGNVSDFDYKVQQLSLKIENINTGAKNLADQIDAVNDTINELGITSIENFISNVNTSNSFTTLFHSINRYMKVYKIQLKD